MASLPASLPGAPPATGLASLLAHPAIWRGRDCAPEPAAVPTGFPALDAVLPGGGWPRGALTEILLAREGIGEVRLLLPALARLQSEGRDVAWIDPPFQPYAPALAAAGLDLTRLLIVRTGERRDALWACEQALRAPECAAAFAWLAVQDERVLRRLAVAAREGGTFGVLWRRPGETARTSAAPLRLGLAPSADGLAVHVLKRRGGEVAEPVVIENSPIADALAVDGHAPSGAGVRALRPVRDDDASRPRHADHAARPDPRTELADAFHAIARSAAG